MARGKLTQNGVHIYDHEYKTVKLFLEQGYNVTLIPQIQVKGIDNADIEMNGVIWEIKAPIGNSKNTIKHNIQNAKQQSRNIILDLRRCGVPENQAIKQAEQHFNLSKRIRKMIIITKDEKILDYVK